MKKIMLILIFFPIIIYGQTKDTIRYSIGILDIYYIFDQLPSRNECDFLEVQLLLIYPPYEIGSCASDVILNEVIYVSYTEYAYVLKEKDALSIPFTHYIGYFDGVPYKHFTDINLKDKNINKKFEDVLLDMKIRSCNKDNIPKKNEMELISYFSDKNETLALLYGRAGATG